MLRLIKTLSLGICLTSSFAFAGKSVTTGVGGICDRTEDVQVQIMKELGIHNCADVTKEDLTRVTGLWFCYLYGNLKHDKTRMTALKVNDFAGLYNLKSLDIEFSEIAVLDKEMFKDLRSLEIFDLSHNYIQTLPEDLFAHNKNLKHIEFDSNIYFSMGTLPEKFFYGLTKLEGVDLDELKIKYLPKNIFQTNLYLNSIDLKGNQLTNIDGLFDHLKYLKNLQLMGNPVYKK
ncbi:MAG: leucine-rich repeat protein [Bacteriovoracaceae bacterium]